ncbi:MAG TPA: PspC domain-containing protein [Bacillus bacterium]|nr:PspC domain-containing protein [Bacillus sp. (in: firmicutes)]
MKSSTNKVLFGVCAGIAEFFEIDPLIVRLIFIFIPASIPVYLIPAYFLQKNPSLY